MASDGIRLRRPVPARLVGTTPTVSILWWALAISLLTAFVTNGVEWDRVSVAMLLFLIGWAVADWTSGATLSRDAVTWRTGLRRRSVPLIQVAAVSEDRLRFAPGELPVVTITTADGRVVQVHPSIAVGSAARAEFIASIRERLRAARPD
jgi:hypothetical protein